MKINLIPERKKKRNMKMNKISISIAALFTSAALLAGCGNVEHASEASQAETASAAFDAQTETVTENLSGLVGKTGAELFSSGWRQGRTLWSDDGVALTTGDGFFTYSFKFSDMDSLSEDPTEEELSERTVICSCRRYVCASCSQERTASVISPSRRDTLSP